MRRFAILAALLAAACGGPEEPKGSSGTSGQALCGGLPGATACTSCREKSCCKEAEACKADTTCSVQYACLAEKKCAAGDEACRAQCAKGASDALVAMEACEAKSCASDCQLTCGGALGTSFGNLASRSASCASCLSAKACDLGTSCGESAGCLGALACTAKCNPLGPGCGQACIAKAGLASDPVVEAKKRCAGECGYGKQLGCLGSVTWPAPAPGVMSADVVIPIIGYSSQKGLPGVSAKACPKFDPTCGSPVAGPVTSDGAGLAKLTLPIQEIVGGFAGFIETSLDGYVPVLSFFYPPFSEPGTSQTIPLLKAAEFDAAAGLLMSTILPDRGHLIAVAIDCELTYAPGIHLEVDVGDDKSVKGHFASGFPKPDANATDATGLAGFFNLPEGKVNVKGTVLATGQTLGTSTALIRKGAISFVSVAPTP